MRLIVGETDHSMGPSHLILSARPLHSSSNFQRLPILNGEKDGCLEYRHVLHVQGGRGRESTEEGSVTYGGMFRHVSMWACEVGWIDVIHSLKGLQVAAFAHAAAATHRAVSLKMLQHWHHDLPRMITHVCCAVHSGSATPHTRWDKVSCTAGTTVGCIHVHA